MLPTLTPLLFTGIDWSSTQLLANFFQITYVPHFGIIFPLYSIWSFIWLSPKRQHAFWGTRTQSFLYSSVLIGLLLIPPQIKSWYLVSIELKPSPLNSWFREMGKCCRICILADRGCPVMETMVRHGEGVLWTAGALGGSVKELVFSQLFQQWHSGVVRWWILQVACLTETIA